MELFLPSFFVILLTAVIVFGILPRLSPFLIFILCSIFLFISVSVHYSMFSSEYKNMISTDFLVNNSTIIMGVVVAIGILLAVSNLFIGTKFSLPTMSYGTPRINDKVITTKKNYSNIPLEKLLEAEKQL